MHLDRMIQQNKIKNTFMHEWILSHNIMHMPHLDIHTSITRINQPLTFYILYTELYANNYHSSRVKTVKLYSDCSILANEIGMKVNAGHDLSLENIEFFSKNMPFLDEVSIGHALISESLYIGLENVINLYINKLN